MTADYTPVLDALMKEGFHLLPQERTGSGKTFDYKITPYSLNTKLSFRFESLAHFVEFLKRNDADSDKRVAVLQATFRDLGLKEGEFFWVNFFEGGKAAEI